MNTPSPESLARWLTAVDRFATTDAHKVPRGILGVGTTRAQWLALTVDERRARLRAYVARDPLRRTPAPDAAPNRTADAGRPRPSRPEPAARARYPRGPFGALGHRVIPSALSRAAQSRLVRRSLRGRVRRLSACPSNRDEACPLPRLQCRPRGRREPQGRRSSKRPPPRRGRRAARGIVQRAVREESTSVRQLRVPPELHPGLATTPSQGGEGLPPPLLSSPAAHSDPGLVRAYRSKVTACGHLEHACQWVQASWS